MKITIMTLFPDMCERVLSESIIGRAREDGLIQAECVNIRDYSLVKTRRVDDSPYGGGMGMVMQAEPIYRCFEDICKKEGTRPKLYYMSPQGKVFDQQKAKDMLQEENIVLLCGHYEGLDERLIEEIVDEELSIGDYVLTGGELPALVVCDTVFRMCSGVLSEDICFEEESHFSGLLEYPQYTRPAVWKGREVPEVLTSGHHKNISDWRYEKSVERTKEKRPDMWKKYISEDSKG